MSVKQNLLNNLKNVWGWRTPRKLVVFAVDDYGNVRLDSQEARLNLNKAGFKPKSRFDVYDTLETKGDLDHLYSVLMSVKDSVGNYAKWTPYSVPANINFERIKQDSYAEYEFELLDETFDKLSHHNPIHYGGAWSLWLEGIQKGLMNPEYHGREHLNLKVFNEKLSARDKDIMAALENRSYTNIDDRNYPTINYTASCDFWETEENELINQSLLEGLELFRKVFGVESHVFMPPTSQIHPSHFESLKEAGVDFIETNLIHRQHMGNGKYKTNINYTGKRIEKGQHYIVRNVVFEPCNDKNLNSVDLALSQIEAAFRWKRPAIVSSHRVNFSGLIEPRNRKEGLEALKILMKSIVKKWPDVEFISSGELGDIMKESIET